MLNDDLFNEVLVRPITEFNSDCLNIVSGYGHHSTAFSWPGVKIETLFMAV